MAFSNPTTYTPPTLGAQTLNKVSSGDYKGIYRKDDGTITMTVSHQIGSSRTRHVIRIDYYTVSADPYIPAQNVKLTMSTYLVVDRPNVGWTIAQMCDPVNGLLALMSASTYARVTDLVSGQS